MKHLLLTRSGIVLVGFLAIGSLLIAYEHRVHIFSGNGVLIALVAFCVGMHFFMHGGHGGHGGRFGGNEDTKRRDRS